ncbi:alkaline phosphatase family protein [Spirosoma sp. RP8]|uniref:Alkaline phosphatase family protein n=1 Tax=Spirosoma liriopis TaxID=2937440 RepID=A0ABT0HFW2_9BACT|nr:alkaline phosphatase family protein [Spirosoma liriopis]MCK8491046.1 alkaline phosphatase family protein [Spirosoma liriopis]
MTTPWRIFGLVTTCWLFSVTLLLAQSRPKKALFIIVDGIPADVIERESTPNLDSIAKQGAYKQAYVGGIKGTYSQTPTISAVGYNSLLTGTWVNKHNVWDNSIKAPNYHYPTIFRLFKEQYPTKKIAVFSSWVDNRTKLVCEGLAQTVNLKLDYHTDGYELDTVRFPHDPERDFMAKIDHQVVSDAVASIQNQAPDLTWVYLEYTDDMGHRYGDSPPFVKAVHQVDAEIGRIWNAIQRRQKNNGEDWQIFITTDHGRDEQTGKNHGGQSPRQRATWLVTNTKNLNAYAERFQPAVVDIMPTMARFLTVSIPKELSREIDGIPLTGPVSLAEPVIQPKPNQLNITWKALAQTGTVNVWLTTTNQFETGGKDTYTLMAKVPLSKEHVVIGTSKLPSSFYKIVLEGPSNTVNRWVVLGEQK